MQKGIKCLTYYDESVRQPSLKWEGALDSWDPLQLVADAHIKLNSIIRNNPRK